VIGAQQAVTTLLSQTISTLLTLVLVLVTMFYLSWQLTVVRRPGRETDRFSGRAAAVRDISTTLMAYGILLPLSLAVLTGLVTAAVALSLLVFSGEHLVRRRALGDASHISDSID
jgi:hypothetical protein